MVAWRLSIRSLQFIRFGSPCRVWSVGRCSRSHVFAAAPLGDERPGRQAADVIFKIDEKKHDRFTRDGNNLVYTQQVSLYQALVGVAFNITHLDGRIVPVQVN